MVSYECPYTVGAEFVLLLAPPSNAQNTPSPSSIRVRILQLFTFSQSQTMKVKIIASAAQYALPSTAFLKLYDRRYLAHRLKKGSKQPWDPHREAQANQIAQKLYSRLIAKCLPNAASLSGFSNTVPTDRTDSEEEILEKEFEVLEKSEEPTAVEHWWNEHCFRFSMKQWFDQECQAYSQLHTLQGLCIPKFYGTTTFDETWLLSPGIHVEVRGILLQFIDGVNIDEIDSKSALVIQNPHLGQAAIECYERLFALGVLHGDVRLANLLLRRDGRVFILDFGRALVRRKDQSDEDWNEQVASHRELIVLSRQLDGKELRDRTPPDSSDPTLFTSYYGYREYNNSVESGRESWRLNYYDPAPDDARVDFRVDENGEKRMLELPLWILKHEKAAIRKRYLDQFRGWGFR